MTLGELKTFLEDLPDDLEVEVEGGGGPEETFAVAVTSVRIRALDAFGCEYDPKRYNPKSAMYGPPIATCVICG